MSINIKDYKEDLLLACKNCNMTDDQAVKLVRRYIEGLENEKLKAENIKDIIENIELTAILLNSL